MDCQKKLRLFTAVELLHCCTRCLYRTLCKVKSNRFHKITTERIYTNRKLCSPVIALTLELEKRNERRIKEKLHDLKQQYLFFGYILF